MAKKDEVDKYLNIACIADLVDLKTSSDDVENQTGAGYLRDRPQEAEDRRRRRRRDR